MPTQNSSDNKFTNNSDGFDLTGGSTARKLTLTGADVTVTGSGTNTYTYPTATTTLVGTDTLQSITNKAVSSTLLHDYTATVVNISLPAGHNYNVSNGITIGSGLGITLTSNSVITIVTVPSGTDVQAYFGVGQYDYVEQGCVWSGDSYGSSLNGSMTAGFVWIGGKRLSVSAISAHAFTASKDTYVDFIDAGNGTANVIYTEATNNAASPVLAGGLRNAIIISGASSIAAATSVNQGQETMLLPIASSTPYAVTDSLGNLICPRDPNRKILGYRTRTSDFSTSNASATQITGLSAPVIVPTNRKIKITVGGISILNSSSSVTSALSIWDGTPGSGTQLTQQNWITAATNQQAPYSLGIVTTPGSTSKTYNAAVLAGAGTVTVPSAPFYPQFILVELV